MSKFQYQSDFRSPSSNSDFRYSQSNDLAIDAANGILSKMAETDTRLGKASPYQLYSKSFKNRSEPQNISNMGGMDYK